MTKQFDTFLRSLQAVQIGFPFCTNFHLGMTSRTSFKDLLLFPAHKKKENCVQILKFLLMVSLNVPSSKGVSAGPKMTAFHCIILLSQGAPLTPAGGSSYNDWKG